MHLIEMQGYDGRLEQRPMCTVRRVESATKDADALRVLTLPFDQTQSRGTRKWLNSRASGEPTGSWRW